MDKILGLIGLAKRAGKISTGEAVCSGKIKSREARLVLIAADASDNTKKSLINSCNYYNIPFVLFSDKQQLGNFTGGGFKSVVAICDGGFAKSISEKIKAAEGKDR